jgi:hypothetical protein
VAKRSQNDSPQNPSAPGHRDLQHEHQQRNCSRSDRPTLSGNMSRLKRLSSMRRQYFATRGRDSVFSCDAEGDNAGVFSAVFFAAAVQATAVIDQQAAGYPTSAVSGHSFLSPDAITGCRKRPKGESI